MHPENEFYLFGAKCVFILYNYSTKKYVAHSDLRTVFERFRNNEDRKLSSTTLEPKDFRVFYKEIYSFKCSDEALDYDTIVAEYPEILI